jgi:hypothetical protein
MSPSLSDGNWYFHIRTRDNAGNWSTCSVFGPWKIDTHVPVTEADPKSGTYSGSVTVTLSVTDNLDPAPVIHYTTDGTDPTTSSLTYSVSIVIPTSKTLKFFAVDRAGNRETTKTEVYVITLRIMTTALPQGEEGVSYQAQLEASGGTPPYHDWEVISGSLPLGLSLDPDIGEITGTPENIMDIPENGETFPFTVSVEDTSSPPQTASKELSITIIMEQGEFVAPPIVDPPIIGPGQTTTLTFTFNRNGNYFVCRDGDGIHKDTGTPMGTPSYGSCAANLEVTVQIYADQLPENRKSKCFVFIETNYRNGNDNPYNDGNFGKFYVTYDHTPPTSQVREPVAGQRRGTVDTISGTASDPKLPSDDPNGETDGSGVGLVQVCIYNAGIQIEKFYDPASRWYTSATPVWLDASGTTNWTFNSSAISWGDDVTYEVRLWSRATDNVSSVEVKGPDLEPPDVSSPDVSFTYDSESPTVSIVSVTPNPPIIGCDQYIEIEWQSDEDGKFYVEVGGDGTRGSGRPIGTPNTGSCYANTPAPPVTIEESELPELPNGKRGASQIWIIVEDEAEPPNPGNTWIQAVDDRVAPVTTIETPKNGSRVPELPQIRGKAIDPQLDRLYPTYHNQEGKVNGAGVEKVEITIFSVDHNLYYDPDNGGRFTSPAPPDPPFRAIGTDPWSYDTRAVPWENGGIYIIRVWSTDKLSNRETPEKEAKFTFLVLPPPPRVTGNGCAFTQRPTRPEDMAGFFLPLVGLILLGYALRWRRRVLIPWRRVAGLLTLAAIIHFCGCVAPHRQPWKTSFFDAPCALSVLESNKTFYTGVTTDKKTTAGVNLGSYVPTTAKETDFMAGPTLGGFLRVHKGLLNNIEFGIGISQSASKREDLETLQGYSESESALFQLRSSYVIPLRRVSRKIDLELLAGGGVVVEASKSETEYLIPATGWEKESRTSSSATLLLDISTCCLWQVGKSDAIEFRLGVMGYPLSDNVTSAVFFSLGYRF